AEVAQPAEVRGRGTQALHHLLARLRPVRRRPVRTGRFRLLVCVDIAELTPETDVQPRVAPGKVLLGVAANALFRAQLQCLWNLLPTAIGIKDPLFPWHRAALPHRTWTLRYHEGWPGRYRWLCHGQPRTPAQRRGIRERAARSCTMRPSARIVLT